MPPYEAWTNSLIHKNRLCLIVFHDPKQLWEIQSLISSLQKGYKFYLHNYTSYAVQTTLYATHAYPTIRKLLDYMSKSLNNLKDFKSINDYYLINKHKLRNHIRKINFIFGAMTANGISGLETILYRPGQFSYQVTRLLKLVGV